MAELDLAAFLRARYDEAENGGKPDRHTADCGYTQIEFVSDECTCGVPAFVLADVAAKRRLLAGHGPGRVVDESDGRWASDPDSWDPPWTKCTGHEWAAYPCELLRLLALPYAGHPDYQEGWKP